MNVLLAALFLIAGFYYSGRALNESAIRYKGTIPLDYVLGIGCIMIGCYFAALSLGGG